MHPTVLVGGLIGVCGVGLVLYPMLGKTMNDAAFKGLGHTVLGMLLTSVGDACSARNARAGIHPLRANAVGFGVPTVVLVALCAFQRATLAI